MKPGEKTLLSKKIVHKAVELYPIGWDFSRRAGFYKGIQYAMPELADVKFEDIENAMRIAGEIVLEPVGDISHS